MSYLALARKWRPRNFEQLLGQSHVVKALVNALDNQKVHHAYLFTGTRGVGKTTIARIFAKSLNCDQGVTSKPCGECASCIAVDQGRFVDLIEIDAASNTKVEDTRDLLDNVQYAPTVGRYKVYLIDEVHMLSTHSFNALLKTLEEPPEHVKFILATTDPQKLPITILSRCLQFNLKPLTPVQIAERLAEILKKEEIGFDEGAIKLLAKSAKGSMRDSLSLLDQAIVYSGGAVEQAQVKEMLGSIDLDHVIHLLEALRDQSTDQMLEHSEQIAQRSLDYNEVIDALMSAIYRLSLLKQMEPEKAQQLLELDEFEGLGEFIDAFNEQDLQLYYQIGIKGKKDIFLAPDLRIGFEMTLLRMLAFNLSNSELANSPLSNSKASISSATTLKIPASQSADQKKNTKITAAVVKNKAEVEKELSPPALENDSQVKEMNPKVSLQSTDNKAVNAENNAPQITAAESSASSGNAPDVKTQQPAKKSGNKITAPDTQIEPKNQANKDDSQRADESHNESPRNPVELTLVTDQPDEDDVKNQHSNDEAKEKEPSFFDLATLSKQNWREFVQSLDVKGIVLQMLMNSVLIKISDKQMIIAVSETSVSWFTKVRVSQVEQAIEACTQQAVKLHIAELTDDCGDDTPQMQINEQKREEFEAATQAFKTHPFVTQLGQEFDAEIIDSTIKISE